MRTLAETAARNAGEVILASFGRASLQVEKKGVADFVTEVDRAAEAEIRQTLAEACPDHGFLLEEGGEVAGKSDAVWYVDPLDGTTNFIHRFPFFSVSLGLVKAGEVVVGVVYDPLRNEMYSAEKGGGTWLNGIAVKVSKAAALDAALLGTGFPFRAREHLDTYLDLFKRIFLGAAGVRRAGSAALDLAYVACGRTEGFFELALSPWDVAAGSLLVREAGGRVSDFHGGEGYLHGGDIVASNGSIHEELLVRTRAVYPEARPRRP